MKALGFTDTTEAHVQEMMSGVDKDSDGSIDFDGAPIAVGFAVEPRPFCRLLTRGGGRRVPEHDDEQDELARAGEGHAQGFPAHGHRRARRPRPAGPQARRLPARRIRAHNRRSLRPAFTPWHS